MGKLPSTQCLPAAPTLHIYIFPSCPADNLRHTRQVAAPHNDGGRHVALHPHRRYMLCMPCTLCVLAVLCLLASPAAWPGHVPYLCLPWALPPAVFLGLLILLAAACALLCWRLTWPRTAAACTALLWLDVALLMLLGAGGHLFMPRVAGCMWPHGFAFGLEVRGMEGQGIHPTAGVPPWLCAAAAGFLRGAYVGASDSCKYAETLVLDVANRTVENPRQQQQARPPACEGSRGPSCMAAAGHQRRAAAGHERRRAVRRGRHVHANAHRLSVQRCVQVLAELEYYFGIRYIHDSRVVHELLGVPTYLLHALVEASCAGAGAGLLCGGLRCRSAGRECRKRAGPARSGL